MAQHLVVADHNGEFRVVQQVVRHRPFVMDEGKLVEAKGTRFGLHKTAEYRPVYVSVRNLKVETRALEISGHAKSLNNRFNFRADFESPFGLDRVFVALDLNSEDAGKVLFLQEVGRLDPNDAKTVEISVPMTQAIGSGRYRLHIFADGPEVFHSQMPLGLAESALDKMVRRRIEGVTDQLPHPLVGPAPEVPRKLKDATGRATVRFTISPTGRVQDPSVTSATHPEFGEAALAAARQWRFLPRIVAGKPVKSVTEMPFVFGKPSTTASTATGPSGS